ncbi:MAG: sugar phosphate isomerase/epimerase [Acidobacteria bacterium]|nr:sugar phosphate isomerase/epimerase [Acidobacteriota bacterium]
MISRRRFLAMPAALALGAEDRIGILCQLGASAEGARKVLDAARSAGYRRVMVNFPWTGVDEAFLKALPGWLRDAGLECEALGAYVNCVAPGTVLMGTRAEDFARAIRYAQELGCRRLVAWTGSHHADLMKADSRNNTPESEEAILRFLHPHIAALESGKLTLALETYITLACPDAPSLARLLKRLPKCVGAVMDPPNLTPIARYAQRDAVLEEMFQQLKGRIAVVHLKDFRLAAGGQSYQLPGPLAGEMNYPLYARLLKKLPAGIPIAAEHLKPEEFQAAREKLLPLFR